MGLEFEDFSLLDVYAKTNPHKIAQKFGQEFVITVTYAAGETQKISRKITKNPDYKPVERNAEDDDREEKLLDE